MMISGFTRFTRFTQFVLSYSNARGWRLIVGAIQKQVRSNRVNRVNRVNCVNCEVQ